MNIKNNLESIMADEIKVTKKMNAAAGVIVKYTDDEKPSILLIQRAADDHWPLHFEFPRGKCDKPIGENIIHCLKREIKEETGLDIKPIELVDIHEYLADEGTRKTTCYNYLCEMKNPKQEIKLSKEHDGFKWVSEIGEVELLVMPEQKKTIEKILNTNRSIVSYPHNDEKIQKVEEYLDHLEEAGPMFVAYMGAMIAKMAHDFYQKNYSAFAKQCKGLPEKEKTICMLQAKARAKDQEANKLSSAISKCSKAKNPEKCKSILQNKVNQANAVKKLSMVRASQLKKG